MDKKYIILIIIAIILAGILVSIFVTKNEEQIVPSNNISDLNNNGIEEKEEKKEENNEIEVLATNLEELKPNSAWCGTFQLVWNDMQNEVVGQEIVFNPQLKVVENLNKQTFKEEDISEEYYYKKFGLKTLELKEEIENGIKDKFDETSDILDKLDWSESALSTEEDDRYLFYAMLKKEFKFENKFDELERGSFENKYDDIEYFGIQEGTDKSVRNQVDVWYEFGENDFAVSLNTSDGDEVILVRNPEGKSFEEVYENADGKSMLYEGIHSFGEKDTLKVPKIDMDVLKKYEELKNKEFPTADGKTGIIAEAIQSIQMQLDHTGGKIKSEAAIDMIKETAIMPEEGDGREFNFDGKFVIFLKESSKDKPYFAASIEDIKLFQ